jgi:hypothetical protein
MNLLISLKIPPIATLHTRNQLDLRRHRSVPLPSTTTGHLSDSIVGSTKQNTHKTKQRILIKRTPSTMDHDFDPNPDDHLRSGRKLAWDVPLEQEDMGIFQQSPPTPSTTAAPKKS